MSSVYIHMYIGPLNFRHSFEKCLSDYIYIFNDCLVFIELFIEVIIDLYIVLRNNIERSFVQLPQVPSIFCKIFHLQYECFHAFSQNNF